MNTLRSHKRLLHWSIALNFVCITSSTYASGQFNLIPGSAPVAIPNTGDANRSFGVGFNTFTVKTEWDDDFYNRDEAIGDTESTATNLALTWAQKLPDGQRRETSFLIGTLSTEQSNDIGTYVSADAGGATMRGQQDVTGFQLGVRHIRSQQFATTGLVNWVWAYSGHVSLFTQSGRIETTDANNQTPARAAYDSDQYGLFIRPLISLQPQLEFGERFRVVPFIAVGFNGWIGLETWSQDVLVYADGSGDGVFCCEDDETLAGFNPEISLGFDIEVPVPFTKERSIGIGGAISALVANNQDSFAELHVVYSFALGD